MRNNEWLFFKNVTAIKKHLNILQTIRGLNRMSGQFSDCVYFRQLFRMDLCNTN
ncbi:conserved domain protein [Acinetobacter baumannii 6013113]|nr:conserved domain protein [Acinetobacter baumannii 6013113]